MWGEAGFSRGARYLFWWGASIQGDVEPATLVRDSGVPEAPSIWWVLGLLLNPFFFYWQWVWLIELDPRSILYPIIVFMNHWVSFVQWHFYTHNDNANFWAFMQCKYLHLVHISMIFFPLPGRCGEDWLHPAAPVLSSIWMETDVCAANTHCQNKQVPKPSEILSKDNTRFV